MKSLGKKSSINSTVNLFYVSNILSKSLLKFSGNYFKFKRKVRENTFD